MRTPSALLLIALLHLSMPATRADGAPSPGQVYISSRPVTIGSIGPDGKLIIDTWGTKPKFFYRTLNDSYGILIWYSKYEKKYNQPEYQFFSQPDRKLQSTGDLGQFLKLLSKIPDGSAVYIYDECGAGTHYEMDESLIDRVRAFLVRKKIDLREPGDKGYCICVCTEEPTELK